MSQNPSNPSPIETEPEEHFDNLERLSPSLVREWNDFSWDFLMRGSIGLRSCNSNGVIIWANECECKSLGYPMNEYVGHRISEFIVDEDVAKDYVSKVQNREIVQNYPVRMKHKDGSIRYMLFDVSETLNPDGCLGHTRCFTRDVTDIRKVEMQLAEQAEENRRAHEQLIQQEREREKERAELREQSAIEASQMKSMFLASMSHELRTPLGAIIGLLSLLRQSAAPPLSPSQSSSFLADHDFISPPPSESAPPSDPTPQSVLFPSFHSTSTSPSRACFTSQHKSLPIDHTAPAPPRTPAPPPFGELDLSVSSEESPPSTSRSARSAFSADSCSPPQSLSSPSSHLPRHFLDESAPIESTSISPPTTSETTHHIPCPTLVPSTAHGLASLILNGSDPPPPLWMPMDFNQLEILQQFYQFMNQQQPSQSIPPLHHSFPSNVIPLVPEISQDSFTTPLASPSRPSLDSTLPSPPSPEDSISLDKKSSPSDSSRNMEDFDAVAYHQLSPLQMEYLDVLSTSADQLLHLINQILDLTRIENGKIDLEKVPFSLIQVMKRTQRMFSYRAKEKGLSLEMEVLVYDHEAQDQHFEAKELEEAIQEKLNIESCSLPEPTPKKENILHTHSIPLPPISLTYLSKPSRGKAALGPLPVDLQHRCLKRLKILEDSEREIEIVTDEDFEKEFPSLDSDIESSDEETETKHSDLRSNHHSPSFHSFSSMESFSKNSKSSFRPPPSAQKSLSTQKSPYSPNTPRAFTRPKKSKLPPCCRTQSHRGKRRDTLYLGDESRWGQVLINLLGNSLKFTNKGRIRMILEIVPEVDPPSPPNSTPSSVTTDSSFMFLPLMSPSPPISPFGCSVSPNQSQPNAYPCYSGYIKNPLTPSTSPTPPSATPPSPPNSPINSSPPSPFDFILLSIEDTGIGIEDPSHLFLPFQQANPTISKKFGGSGLGLSICHGIIEKMGGKIQLRSELGIGTTIYIEMYLPRAEPHHFEKEESEESETATLSERDEGAETTGRDDSLSLHSRFAPAPLVPSYPPPHPHPLFPRILIVEDVEVNRKILIHMLLRLGIGGGRVETNKTESPLGVSSSRSPSRSPRSSSRSMQLTGTLGPPSRSRDRKLKSSSGGSKSGESKVLRPLGLKGQVIIAENGREAVEEVLRAKERGERFDICLMDCLMPVMDGYEATREIRSLESQWKQAYLLSNSRVEGEESDGVKGRGREREREGHTPDSGYPWEEKKGETSEERVKEKEKEKESYPFHSSVENSPYPCSSPPPSSLQVALIPEVPHLSLPDHCPPSPPPISPSKGVFSPLELSLSTLFSQPTSYHSPLPLPPPPPILPIIAVTAGALFQEREKCLACGMNTVLTKPFTIEDLRSELQKFGII